MSLPKGASFFAKHLRRCWDKEIYWKDAYKGASADIFFITTMKKASTFIAAIKEEAVNFQYPAEDIGLKYSMN